MKNKMADCYSSEVRPGAVRMVLEHQGSHTTLAGAIAAIAGILSGLSHLLPIITHFLVSRSRKRWIGFCERKGRARSHIAG